jgi:RNA polymerase sigma-70 factor (ECF subfamily)
VLKSRGSLRSRWGLNPPREWLLNPRQSNSSAERWLALNELTDELLVLRLLDGEQDALTILFDRYHKLVFSVAVRIVDDSGEAEEVVQTVFLDFFRGLASFDPKKGILRVWLLQYAYHRALNRRRHLAASRFYKWVDVASTAAEPSLSWNPSDVAEIARLMDQLLNALSPRRRQVLELTYLDGLTAEEIAVKLGQSVNVVRHELYRALAQLRKLLVQQGHVSSDRALHVQTGALKADA